MEKRSGRFAAVTLILCTLSISSSQEALGAFIETFDGMSKLSENVSLTGQYSGPNAWQYAAGLAGSGGGGTRLYSTGGLNSRGVQSNWSEDRANAIAIEPGTIAPGGGTLVVTMDMIDDPISDVGLAVGTSGLLNGSDNFLYSRLNVSGSYDLFRSITNGAYVSDNNHAETLTRPTSTWKNYKIEVDLNSSSIVTSARQYIDGSLAGSWNFGATPTWTPTHVGFSLARSGESIDQAADNFSYSFIPTVLQPGRPVDFGNQWVRDNPFTLMSWTTTLPDAQQFLDAGLNSNMSGNGGPIIDGIAAGIPWHFMNSYGIASFALHQQDIEYLLNMPGNLGRGWYLQDEPDRSQFSQLGHFARWLKQRAPDTLVYAGVMGKVPSQYLSGDPANTSYTYEQYLDDYLRIVQPDVLMYNNYPNLSQGRSDYDAYFSNLMIVRQKAQQHGIPYFNWVRATVLRGSPGESEMRWQIFTSLAAGYKGLDYFLYQTEYDEAGLVNLNTGEPNAMYPVVVNANIEVANLGRSLRFLESTDVYYASFSGHGAPEGLQNWHAGAQPKIIGISLNTPSGEFTDGLIGLFTDDFGDEYFMLTNLNFNTNSASNDSVNFRISFDSSTHYIFRLNRLTGEPERLVLNNHVLDLILPGGTGDLFKFDDGNFAGIQMGDADLDGDVDLSDLSALAAHYGSSSNVRWSRGDFDLDGDVDLSDLSTLATWYGSGEAQAMADFAALSNVPEPAAAGLLAWGVLLLNSRGCAERRR